MKIYLAGGNFWDDQHNWRFDLVRGLSQYKEPDYEHDEDIFDWPVMENALFDCLDYVGPYPDVRINQMESAIRQADFIFAWFDDLLPAEVGRVSTELGYAAALKKMVMVGSPDTINPSYLEAWVAINIAAIYPDALIYDNPRDAFIKALNHVFDFLPMITQLEFKHNKHNPRHPLVSVDHLRNSGYVYLIKAETGEYKIGRTANLPNRMRLFAVKLPFSFEIIHYFLCTEVKEAEAFLHRLYAPQRKRGEWFELTKEDEQSIKRVRCFSNPDFVDFNDEGVFTDHPRFNEVWKSFGL